MTSLRHFITQYTTHRRYFGAAFWLNCLIGLWISGPNTAFAQNTVQRDPQALTILAQAISASGGQEAITAIQDLTETGTVTYNWTKPVTGNVTVKTLGRAHLKIEASLSTGKRTTVFSSKGSSLKEENGRIRQIDGQSVSDAGAFALPCQLLIEAVADPSINIVFSGVVTHNGVSVYDVRLEKSDSGYQGPGRDRGIQDAKDFYINPQTSLVTAISDRFHPRGSRQDSVQHEVQYSNYQTQNGIASPLTITEIVRGQISFTMSLDQVTLNSGLKDADFAQ